MLLSTIIPTLTKDFFISEIIDEQEITSLGLVNAELEYPFCSFLEDIKFADSITKNARMVITKKEYIGLVPEGRGIYISEYPRLSYFLIHNYLSNLPIYKIRDDFDSIIGENANISPQAFIAKKNVKIGRNVKIENNVTIKENTIIGDDCIFYAGTVIGGEGFEFKRLPNGNILNVTHCGWVIIGNDVLIKCNSCVDKALYPWDVTLISNHCRLDNLVHIGHGVKLFESVFMAAGVSTGGRTVFGKNVWVGVGATVSNALTIGNNARVNIGAVVTKNVEDNASVSGNFAISHDKYIQFIKTIR